VIEPGDNVKCSEDRQAMGALLRSVLKEMWQMLGSKKTVKEAWCGGINPRYHKMVYGPHHLRWPGSQNQGVHRKIIGCTRYCNCTR
jgi:hypothetical protein